MAIAMKDLEIRGAGNLLGGEQSGHIADVGFDLYVRLVGEAVTSSVATPSPSSPTMRIELPIDAHLPHDYVPSERLRLEMYKRLAEVRTDDDVALHPRGAASTGTASRPAAGDAACSRSRASAARARQAGLTDVTVQGKYVRFAPVELPDSARSA